LSGLTIGPMHLTLPRQFYTDPEFYGRELERFFFTRWICAGRADQIPNAGDFFTRSVANESVIVTRDRSGAVHALFNVCRHRGTRLCDTLEGHLADRILCPYHNWTYDLTGRLLAAPHMPPEFTRDDYPLHRAGCDIWDGHLFVHLGQVGLVGPVGQEGLAGRVGQGGLREQLADLPERFAAYRMQDLRSGRRIVYDVRANWKLIVQNYNECLHCPNLHPALNRLHHSLAAENVPPTSTYCGGAMGFRSGVETMSTDGARRRDVLPGLTDVQRQRVEYFTIYPNLLLTLHPDYMMTHTLWPRAHDRTEIVCEWHFHPDEMAKPGFEASDAIEFWDTTNREDWWITEQSQLGIGSRVYEPGPYSEREALLWSFDAIVRREADSEGTRTAHRAVHAGRGVGVQDGSAESPARPSMAFRSDTAPD
jgi:Rieske 2Fe-2S family protein